MTTVTYTNELTDDLVLDAAVFFQGWPRRPDAVPFAAVLRGSHAVELVVDADHRVVGFVNATHENVPPIRPVT